MKHHLALLAAAALWATAQAPALAATYTYIGATYTSNSISPFTAPCATPTCADFTTTMRQTGSFTTAVPLAANLNHADILPLITSYSFNDGLYQYSSTASGDNMLFAFASTDSAGNIVASDIQIFQWQTASHGLNDRVNAITVDAVSRSNTPCPSLESPGVCRNTNDDASTSRASIHVGASGWSTNAAPSGPPTITSPTPPGGTLGVPYSYTVVAAGAQPMNFIDAGTLPAGLSIDPNTGAITGTPLATGSYQVTLTANNGLMPSAVQSFTMAIAPAAAVQAVPVDNPFALALATAGMLGLALRGRRTGPFK
ncbi:Ig domain-containing protein [Acidovorax sp. ACV01]|uniref:Ig domain-containing protein n=1 Tax=Acidovorax sp. ACV01 TaxID=2769311 RepID=UPI001781E9B2|nr:Ig domain-containing protein [Acidovorax sp. ACV01]MBD9392944.1 putative Ig domain-containing protein [Acidovorax sp. ACV01]